jgi:InsA N-terminal domain
MMSCPSCQSTTRQVKHGRNPSGSQLYQPEDTCTASLPSDVASVVGRR